MTSPETNSSKTKSSETKRIAYSYARFSSMIQGDGDSLRRQYELSDNWAAENNLCINKTLTDRGISSYRSDNLKEGALGAFIAAIKRGKVKPGSVLLVEALDRLSRDQILQQLTLFLTIIRAGIEIVTLADKRVYTAESINKNPTELIISIVYMIRGWSESETRGNRVRAAWDANRSKAATRRVTAKCPLWLKPSNKPDEKFEVRPERAAIVREIFESAATGKGETEICKELNERKIETWGTGKYWNRNYIIRILRGRAVLGEFQPQYRLNKNVRAKAGEPIPNYYPKIIEPDLWHRANKYRDTVPAVRKTKDGEIGNLFTKRIFDGPTGAPMRYRRASQNGMARLFSSAVERGLATNGWSYDIVESVICRNLEKLDWETILESPEDVGTARETKKIQTELDEVRLQLDRVLNFVAKHHDLNSKSLATKISHLENQQTALERRLNELQGTFSDQSEATVLMREARAEVLAAIKKGDKESRLRLRAELGVLIKRIDLWCNPQQCTEVQGFYPLMEAAVRAAGMEWVETPSGWPCLRITFANGEIRWVLVERCANKKRKSKSQGRRAVQSIVVLLPTTRNITQ